jgi:serine/threonine-protein kinase
MDRATKPIGATQPGGQPPTKQAVDLTGTTLGDYRILRRLGQGGMGQVYLAEQIALKRHVALKLLNPELAADADSLKRFEREATAVAKATHANIVQVYAFQSVGGHHLIALEYVEGKNLREYLEKKGPPEILLGLSIMRQVAAALQRASELGIIHRDIKPDNVLLTRKGEVKVADFGLSRAADDQSLTKSHISMGTPLYMSPEQFEAKKTIDHRADIYSFGATCYHMFAGHPPFKGTAPLEIAVQHLQNEPQPLAEIRPDLPRELCAIIHKMMAKSPADRYQMGREIVRDVAKLRDTLVGSAHVTVPPAGPSAPPSTSTTPAPRPEDVISTLAMPRWRPPNWRRRLLLASLPVALVFGLALGWLVNRRTPAAPPEERPAAQRRDSLKAREEELLKLIGEQLPQSGDYLKLATAQNYSIDLSLIYLSDRDHLDDADRIANELTAKPYPFYKVLGKLGSAMVLAFKDQPAPSNKMFADVLDKDKVDKAFWKNSKELRRMIAKALQFNLRNDPAGFPDKLRPFLGPPTPTLKAP